MGAPSPYFTPSYCVVCANLLSAMDDEYAKLIRRMNPPRYFAHTCPFFSIFLFDFSEFVSWVFFLGDYGVMVEIFVAVAFSGFLFAFSGFITR